MEGTNSSTNDVVFTAESKVGHLDQVSAASDIAARNSHRQLIRHKTFFFVL